MNTQIITSKKLRNEIEFQMIHAEIAREEKRIKNLTHYEKILVLTIAVNFLFLVLIFS